MSSIDSRTITIKEARSRLNTCFKLKKPAFLWGPPGVGKSELMQFMADSKDLGNTYVIDMRCALLEPTDLRGYPVPDTGTGTMIWLPPVDLPTEEFAKDYDTIILLLDELNSAPPAVQAACYQLILNRRIGQYKLPDNVVVVAAGNRESDKGVTYRMPTPLANRFLHLEIRADFDCWFEYAVDNGVHEDVLGYLSFAKQDLFDFDPRGSGRSFATPRSWTLTSDICKEDLTDDELMDLVAGAVGEGLATKFMTHRKHAKDLPLPADVLEGKIKKVEIKEISAQYALTIGMCYELKANFDEFGKDDNEKWHKRADNFFRFMMDSFPTEMTVMGCRIAINQYNLPFQPGKLKNFDEFYERFGKYVTASEE